MIRRKRLVQQYGDGPAVELATFTFDGQCLLVQYASSDIERRLQRGIIVGDEMVTPDDPARFFDGFDGYSARSSSLVVVADCL